MKILSMPIYGMTDGGTAPLEMVIHDRFDAIIGCLLVVKRAKMAFISGYLNVPKREVRKKHGIYHYAGYGLYHSHDDACPDF